MKPTGARKLFKCLPRPKTPIKKYKFVDGVGVTYGGNEKFDFGTHMGWFGISGAGICMKFRSGCNGIGKPGPKK